MRFRQECRGFGPFAATALALVLGLVPPLVSEAAAQSRSGIIINNDVLNSLGAGPEAPFAPLPPAVPLPHHQAPGQAQPAEPAGTPVYSGLQPYGSDSFVVTRPGTLLFPPLQAPASTLTPGFAGAGDNHAARTRAFDNAFAEGPEPSSQLLIPPQRTAGQTDAVIVNLDALPPLDPNADQTAAPTLVLRQPPQPAPRKPAVPAEALARLQQPEATQAPAAFAPEFSEPEMPEIVDLPPEVLAQPSQPAAVEPVAVEPVADEVAEQPEPAAMTPAPAASETQAATGAQEEPAAREESVAADSTLAEPQPAETPAPAPLAAAAEPAAPASSGAPLSLLPVGSQTTTGLQTASLTVSGIDDTSLLFDGDSAELSAEARSELRSLAAILRGEADGEIQVLGFASGQEGAEDQARKLALSRALKVRSFLIDEGIASARIRVRSLGDRTEGGPANRVDIKPIGS